MPEQSSEEHVKRPDTFEYLKQPDGTVVIVLKDGFRFDPTVFDIDELKTALGL